MGFYHKVKISETLWSDEELSQLGLVECIKKYELFNTLRERRADIEWKGGHPYIFNFVFGKDNLYYFQDISSDNQVNEYCFYYMKADELLKKCNLIADFIETKKDELNDKGKEILARNVNIMFDIPSCIGELGRSWGLYEENAFVILDMRESLDYCKTADDFLNPLIEMDRNLEGLISTIKSRSQNIELS